MTDARTIASRYIELWNERNPQRRRDILAANWVSDAKYVDPLMSGDGHDGIDALVAGVQQRFPDFRRSRSGCCHDFRCGDCSDPRVGHGLYAARANCFAKGSDHTTGAI